MSNSKKIERDKITVSVADFERAVRNAQAKNATVEWNGIKIRVRRMLNLEYMLKFVNYFVGACFDSNTNEYLPEVKDFAFRSALIRFYTNITLPDDVGKQYRLLYGTDLIDVVSQNVDSHQRAGLLTSCYEKLEYLAESNIERVVAQADKAVGDLEELVRSVTAVFSGVSESDITKIAGAIGGDSFDMNKLVESFVKKELIDGATGDVAEANSKEGAATIDGSQLTKID